MTTDEPDWDALVFEAGRVFTPNTPVDERALFSGRAQQIRRVIDVVNQKGQHAIIFGERGVGKTSLANVLHEYLAGFGGQILAPRVNCDGGDTFDSVWRKVFEQITLIRTQTGIGFNPTSTTTQLDSTDLLGSGTITPDTVRRALARLARMGLPILIIDEFDRLHQKPRRAFADTIKTLSDHSVPATVVLVGVADSVPQLIEEHESIARALVQIPMPRMRPEEIAEIVANGMKRLAMTISSEARGRIVLLAQGLPHYAHLIGLHAARAALDDRLKHISTEAVDRAIGNAIADAQQSIRTAYHAAIRSPRKDNLFAAVLLSCALAKTDELGFFAAQDVRSPMRSITGKDYEIPSFAQHLNEFSDTKRGNILKKTGDARRYRFRFSDPLMQPFVIMQGIVAGKVPDAFPLEP